MKKFFCAIIFLITMLSALNIKAIIPQSDDSLAVLKQRQDSVNFITNLMGLRDLWWVQTAASNKYLVRPPANRDINYIPTFDDEEYLQRIKNINSVVKLSYNPEVRSIINLYTLRKRDLSEFMLGFSEYYFPIFEQIFDKEGLPQELKYLALIESALNPRATSKVGAVGLWQFMYSTGRMYGLKINSFVDERRDPIKSTVAAARFLKDLYAMFNDWSLAIAAYNCGPGNVRKAIKRSGGKSDFWEVYPFLPQETRGYVPAYIAATYVMNYNEQHNLYPRVINIPTTVDTIMIKQRLHLQQVSDVLKIPIQLLEDMNPQYRINVIPYDESSNPLFLPGEFGEKFIELQDSIYSYKDSIFFDPDYLRKQPSRYAYKEQSSGSKSHSSNKSKDSHYYIVKRGDNLSKIANKYGVTVADIKKWNKLKSNVAQLGQKLIVYDDGREQEKDTDSVELSHKELKSGISKKIADKNDKENKEEKSEKEEKKSSTNDQVAKTEKSEKKSDEIKSIKSEPKDKIVIYEVKSGDTLWSIAKKYPGVSEQEIAQLNGIKNKNSVMKGMKLKIKLKG